jgi:hypothetical protein
MVHSIISFEYCCCCIPLTFNVMVATAELAVSQWDNTGNDPYTHNLLLLLFQSFV